MVFESLLNNLFSVFNPVRIPDGSGGNLIDYDLSGTVFGRVRPASSREREVALQEQREITHVFYTTYPSPVARGYRLIVDDLTLEVLGVREPSKSGEHVEVDCREIQLDSEVNESVTS